MSQIVNFSTRKVGGIRFVKIGRLTLSFSLSRAYKPLDRRADRPTIPMEAEALRYASHRDWMNALHNAGARTGLR